MNRYFRAAYSALCGNVNVLKSVCSTWEDLLWAYTKCLVDTNVELQIREILGKIIFTLFWLFQRFCFYGNLGCQVLKGGIQNQIVLWPKINKLPMKILYFVNRHTVETSNIGHHFRKQSVLQIEIVKKWYCSIIFFKGSDHFWHKKFNL